MFLVTAAQMQSLDQRTIEEAKVPGTTLMENAGRGVVEAIEHAFGSPAGKRVTIFCGKGNNGGGRIRRGSFTPPEASQSQCPALCRPYRTYRRCTNNVSPTGPVG